MINFVFNSRIQTMNIEINYCPRCGNKLVNKGASVRSRPSCTDCGYVVYLDPKLATVVLISVGDELVLVRRAIEPQIGRWSYPGGYVDRGETGGTPSAGEEVQEISLFRPSDLPEMPFPHDDQILADWYLLKDDD